MFWEEGESGARTGRPCRVESQALIRAGCDLERERWNLKLDRNLRRGAGELWREDFHCCGREGKDTRSNREVRTNVVSATAGTQGVARSCAKQMVFVGFASWI